MAVGIVAFIVKSTLLVLVGYFRMEIRKALEGYRSCYCYTIVGYLLKNRFTMNSVTVPLYAASVIVKNGELKLNEVAVD